MNTATSDKRPPTCLLSFDVEAHCQIEAARGVIAPSQWHRWPCRIERNVDWLLSTLAEYQARATFFVLGSVASREPRLVRKIASAGHEIACHGYAHDRLHRLTPQKLAIDLAAARAAIEDQSQKRLSGYRAPSFSLHAQTDWAVDVIAEQGFTYDSSVQPVHHPSYGQADAPRTAYRLIGRAGSTLAEIPPLTWQLGRHRLPVAGGGYFRLLPLWFMTRGIAQAHRADQPAPLYWHPWEFDVSQRQLPLTGLQKLRTYRGIDQARRRLMRLLKQVRGTTYGDWLAAQSTADWPAYQLPSRPDASTDSDPSAYDVLSAQGDEHLNRDYHLDSLRGAA